MTRDAWECSSGQWQVQNRRSILIGKAILDSDRPIGGHPTRSHRPTRTLGNGNSGPRSLSCPSSSNRLQFKALALSPDCPPDMCLSIYLYNNATYMGGVGVLSSRRPPRERAPTI